MKKRAKKSPLSLPFNHFLLAPAPQHLDSIMRTGRNCIKGRLHGDRQSPNFGRSYFPNRKPEPLFGQRFKGSFNRERRNVR